MRTDRESPSPSRAHLVEEYTTSVRFATRALLFIISLVIFFGTGELALRVIYRDAGKRTLGGPGGHSFEHLAVRDDLRGRFDIGPKTPGKKRIMILGDSITWGQGVRNWQDVWPEQLAVRLEQAGRPHEMAVFAMPGRDIPDHVREMEKWGSQVKPDVFIYQWYVNDIEVASARPNNARRWQMWAGHNTLRSHSYLYYFLDNRLATYLPQPDRSYVQYVLQDFAPGSREWAEFERYFHELATRARELAPIRLLIIYPQVPFRGTAPLQAIYDRVKSLASSHTLAIPPAAWVRFAGRMINRNDAPWGQGLQVSTQTPGQLAPIFETGDYYMPAGPSEVTVKLCIDKPVIGAAGEGETADVGGSGFIELIDPATNVSVAGSGLPHFLNKTGWQEARVSLIVPDVGRRLRFRLRSARSGFTLGSIEIGVDYGFRVVDLTDALNTFDTHSSIFDAHPNERAHTIVAQRVFEALDQAESAH